MLLNILTALVLASGITIKPTSGSGNFVSSTVDFGASGSDTATLVVTGQAWVTASSVVICTATDFATADRVDGSEDAAVEGLTVGVSTRVAGTGYTLTVNPAQGFAFGKFLIHCTGG